MNSDPEFTLDSETTKPLLSLIPPSSNNDISPTDLSAANLLEMPQDNVVFENSQIKTSSLENAENLPNLTNPIQTNLFERISRFKFDQMFPRTEQVLNELQRPFKLKREHVRRFSTERTETTTKNMLNKKLVHIEDRLRKLNGFIRNEFNEKKRYLNNFQDEAIEKFLFLRKQTREALLGIKPENNNNSVNQEERKEEDSEPFVSINSNNETQPLIELVNNTNNEVLSLAPTSSDETQDTLRVVPDTRQEEITENNAEHELISTDPLENQVHVEQRENENIGSRTVEPEINGLNGENRENVGNIGTENIENNNPAENAEVREDNLETIVNREAHFRLRRAVFIFICIFLCSMFLTLVHEGEFSHRSFFTTIYTFLIYYFIEGCKRTLANEVVPWKKIENFFNTFDIVAVTFFLIVVDLKISGIISSTSLVAFIPLTSSILYYFYSKAPKSVVESQALTRVFFTVQIFLITAKIDGMITFPWKGVLCLVWGYLAMMTLFFILLLFMMALMLILSLFGITLYQNMDRKTQIIGFFWYLCYIGMGPLFFVTMIGVCDAFDNKYDFKLIYDCLHFAKFFSIGAIALTRLIYPVLIVFLQKFNIDSPEFRIEIDNPNSPILTKIEVEKRDTYLVMVSSTYFLPLKQSFIVRSKENLKRCKRALVGSKNRIVMESGPKEGSTSTVNKGVTGSQPGEPISIAALRKDNEELTKMLLKGNASPNVGNKVNMKKGISREKSYDMLKFPIEKESGKDRDDLLDVKYKGECFSEADKEYIENWELLSEGNATGAPSNEKENLCYICFERMANAVIMKCGHGGICYECALEFVKTKNQCMECRGEIESIVKFDPVLKGRNLVKGYETSKLIGIKDNGVKEDEEERF